MENPTAVRVRSGETLLTKPTKVMALHTGYSDVLRSPGDIFTVPAGTIMSANCWFRPVDQGSVETEVSVNFEQMTTTELKVLLAKEGVDFTGVNKKSELIALLVNARDAENNLA